MSQSVKLLIRAVTLLVLGVWLGVTYVLHYGHIEVMLASVALLVMAATDVAAIRRERGIPTQND